MADSRDSPIDPPQILSALPRSQDITLSWRKRREQNIDGFLVFIGTSPTDMLPSKKIPIRGEVEYYTFAFERLSNNRTYYVAVISYRGRLLSKLSDVWQVIPNTPVAPRSSKKHTMSSSALTPNMVRMCNIHLGVGAEASSRPPAQPDASRPSLLEQPVTPVPKPKPKPKPKLPEPVHMPPPPADGRAATCRQCADAVRHNAELQFYVCQGCNRRYVRRPHDGAFLQVSELRYGVCSCCNPRYALFPVAPGASVRRCMFSEKQYIETDRGLVLLSSLDYGLCTCCTPPNVLILNLQSLVICSVQKDQLYIRDGDRYVLKPKELPPVVALPDIGQAIADQAAEMGPNGVLIKKKRDRR